MTSIEEFAESLNASINLDVELGTLFPAAFFEHISDLLVDLGEISNSLHAPYKKRGIQIDGWSGELDELSGELSLVLQDCQEYEPGQPIETLGTSDLSAIRKRATTFIEKALDQDWIDRLEESHPATHLAVFIKNNWPNIKKFRLILITNRQLTERVKRVEDTSVGQKPLSTVIWDLNRLHRLELDGSRGAPIEIDFLETFGEGLLTIEVPASTNDFDAYMCVVPGVVLAKLYSEHGARLLEQNVRVFLQARGKVNRGIRDTIKSQPQNFFAFNNGLTATAEDVRIKKTSRGTEIVGLKNLQIVNGGQTTCSIHAAHLNSESKENLKMVSVQMKLTRIDGESVEEFVPLISRFANSQNKVSDADFFSNHPFHKRIKDFSDRVLIRSTGGAASGSKWFYERARGQYQDERNKHRTKAAKARFDLEYPKKNMFTKTDLAKFDMCSRKQPHTVCKGAQKNFLTWSGIICSEWDKSSSSTDLGSNFNELYFKHSISKAILFRETEKIVSKAAWYNGYRANIVAYALSHLWHYAGTHDLEIDLDQIWENQELNDVLRSVIELFAFHSYEHLQNTPLEGQNIGEWSKKEQCWNTIQATQPANVTPESVKAVSVHTSTSEKNKKDAASDQKEINRFTASDMVISMEQDQWMRLDEWVRTHGYLSHPRDKNIIAKAVRGELLDARPAMRALAILNESIEKGFKL